MRFLGWVINSFLFVCMLGRGGARSAGRGPRLGIISGGGVHQLMLSGSDPVGWAGLHLYQNGGGSSYLPKCIVENGGGRQT